MSCVDSSWVSRSRCCDVRPPSLNWIHTFPLLERCARCSLLYLFIFTFSFVYPCYVLKMVARQFPGAFIHIGEVDETNLFEYTLVLILARKSRDWNNKIKNQLRWRSKSWSNWGETERSFFLLVLFTSAFIHDVRIVETMRPFVIQKKALRMKRNWKWLRLVSILDVSLDRLNERKTKQTFTLHPDTLFGKVKTT